MKHNKLIVRNCCPACGCEESSLYLTVPDFRVTQLDFEIHTCSACGLHFTKDVPPPSDIGRYYKSDSYDSHRLDNNSMISRLYRLVRQINLKKKISWLRPYLSDGVVVDYGCGLGHFVKSLNDAGFNASGYEIDKDTRELSKTALGLELFPLEDFQKLDDESIDALTMWHVLEHIYDLNDDFTQIVKRIKTKGVLMIAVPNFRSYDAVKYGKYWEAYDVPRHLYHFDQNVLISFVERFGFMHKETIPMKFDSYYVSMRSEKNIKNGSVLRGVWLGFLSNLKAKQHGYSSHVFVFLKN